METETQVENVEAVEIQPRDYDTEARGHGWTPKDDFRGDPAKWVDAETFVRRADEVLPLLKKQNAGLKREMDDLKRQVRQASAHFSKSEERAYQRAKAELEQRHDEAVEVGDKAAARRASEEMRALESDRIAEPLVVADDAPTQDQLRAELAAWVESNDWYGADDIKTKYADMQAELMGPAEKWADGRKAWFAELERRTETKFAARRPAITTGTSQPSPGGRGGKSFADLPPEAKRMCEKWVKSGVIKSRDDYVKSYQWD